MPLTVQPLGSERTASYANTLVSSGGEANGFQAHALDVLAEVFFAAMTVASLRRGSRDHTQDQSNGSSFHSPPITVNRL
jgi:hypothetical protein